MAATSGWETAGDDDNNLDEQLAARDYEWSSSVIGETQAQRNKKKLDSKSLIDWQEPSLISTDETSAQLSLTQSSSF